MLLGIKIEAVSDGWIVRVTVAGLMLGDGKAAVKDAVCFCDRNGEIKHIDFAVTAAGPDIFGERQAKHLKSLCESCCKRITYKEGSSP